MLASWERSIVEVDTGDDRKIPAVDAHALIREALQRFKEIKGRTELPLTHDRQVETLAGAQRHVWSAVQTHRLRDGLQWGAEMPDFNSRRSPLAVAALTALVWTAPAPGLAEGQGGPVPDFSSNNAAWVFGLGDYIAIPGEPSPTRNDPAHPYVSNNEFRATGAQPTFRVADLGNPNIKPWAKEIMKQQNDKALSGGIPFSWRASCMPSGVPAFMMAAVEPIHFVQTPKQVTMIFTGDAQVRRIYLDVPHSADLKPSWYGESVGHYEGDTLVVDTIGLNDKTFVDNYRTPHTEKLHVVERYRLVDDGRALEVTFRVEDPGTFYQPWSAIGRLRRVQTTMREEACAENNQQLFDYHIPVADESDF